MRTAITLHRTKAGWTLASGPDVPADKQRYNFNNIGTNWPKDVLEVAFQQNDGPRKIRLKEKAENIARQTADAAKHADEKLALAKKREEEQKAAEAKHSEEKAKAEAAANAKILEAKKQAKAPPK